MSNGSTVKAWPANLFQALAELLRPWWWSETKTDSITFAGTRLPDLHENNPVNGAEYWTVPVDKVYLGLCRKYKRYWFREILGRQQTGHFECRGCKWKPRSSSKYTIYKNTNRRFSAGRMDQRIVRRSAWTQSAWIIPFQIQQHGLFKIQSPCYVLDEVAFATILNLLNR